MKHRIQAPQKTDYTLKSGRVVRVGDTVTIQPGTGYNEYDRGILNFRRAVSPMSGTIKPSGSAINAVCDPFGTVYIKITDGIIASTDITLVD